MRIEITPKAKDSLMGFCDRVGMTQVAAMSRMVDWFSDQTEVVQAAILGLYPGDIRADVARLILEKMAGDGKK
jgi:hypothetical protein